MLDLRRLRYFVTVAEERSFTRAAERLHVAQPALSRQLRQLEGQLGVELMRRTTHSVELTDAGLYLLAEAQQLLAEAASLERVLRAFGDGTRGRLTVAYGTSAAYDTAPRLLAAVAERLPDLDVATQVASVDGITAGLADGTIDVGIVRCPTERPGIDCWLLRLERQGVLLHEAHRLADAPEIALDVLGDEAILLHPRPANPGHYDAVLGLLRDAAIDPRIEQRDISVDLQNTPVLRGRAVAIVGESTRPSVARPLRWVPLSGLITLEVRLLARAANRTPGAERFVQTAVQAADDLAWRRQDQRI